MPMIIGDVIAELAVELGQAAGYSVRCTQRGCNDWQAYYNREYTYCIVSCQQVLDYVAVHISQSKPPALVLEVELRVVDA